MGWLSDKFDIWILAIASLVGACLSTFIVWGVLSFSLAGILAYSVVYGLASGGWSSLWYGFVNPVASKYHRSLLVSVSLILICHHRRRPVTFNDNVQLHACNARYREHTDSAHLDRSTGSRSSEFQCFNKPRDGEDRIRRRWGLLRRHDYLFRCLFRRGHSGFPCWVGFGTT